MINPVEFGQEVRTEARKVVWPGRREVLITTAMVFVLSAIAAVFFLVVDWGIRTGLRLFLGIG